MSSDDSNTGIFEPLLPPLQDITKTNRGPIALATAVTLIIITTLTVVVKLWTRYATTRNFGGNDYMMMAATVSPSFKLLLTTATDLLQAFAFAQSILLSIATDHGLGKHITDIEDTDLIKVSKVRSRLTVIDDKGLLMEFSCSMLPTFSSSCLWLVPKQQ